jgi:hypothetical protein
VKRGATAIACGPTTNSITNPSVALAIAVDDVPEVGDEVRAAAPATGRRQHERDRAATSAPAPEETAAAPAAAGAVELVAFGAVLATEPTVTAIGPTARVAVLTVGKEVGVFAVARIAARAARIRSRLRELSAAAAPATATGGNREGSVGADDRTAAASTTARRRELGAGDSCGRRVGSRSTGPEAEAAITAETGVDQHQVLVQGVSRVATLAADNDRERLARGDRDHAGDRGAVAFRGMAAARCRAEDAVAAGSTLGALNRDMNLGDAVGDDDRAARRR